MNNRTIISNFYEAFSQAKADSMLQHYAKEVTFYDPAFGTLTGNQPHAMWKMLTGRFNDQTKITFEVKGEVGNTVTVKWIAIYQFGPKKRWVKNQVTSTLQLKNGKIFHHHDDFDLWKWSKQALGLPGLLLGWSNFMQNKIQLNTNAMLAKYMAKKA